MENKFYLGALGGSLISYLISCFLPCFSTSQESTIGYYCLLGGWTFIISDFWMFMIWSSNILYLCSLIMIVTNNSVNRRDGYLFCMRMPNRYGGSIFCHQELNIVVLSTYYY